MGRQNYMTIAVADTVQDMFNEFVTRKEIKKTNALNDVLEMYMLAKDEGLYLELKKKYLKVEGIKDMIADRDSSINESVNEFLFIKLSKSETNDGDELDGEETMKVYIRDAVQRGYTWFSTQSLFYGMSQTRVKYFNDMISQGKDVTVLFAVNNENYDNDIAFRADILEIRSDKLPVESPDSSLPNEFFGERARIWIKLANIKEEKKINASMLRITSTGRDVKQTISNSQFHFGYVSFKD